jgi:hypothetical protein
MDIDALKSSSHGKHNIMNIESNYRKSYNGIESESKTKSYKDDRNNIELEVKCLDLQSQIIDLKRNLEKSQAELSEKDHALTDSIKNSEQYKNLLIEKEKTISKLSAECRELNVIKIQVDENENLSNDEKIKIIIDLRKKLTVYEKHIMEQEHEFEELKNYVNKKVTIEEFKNVELRCLELEDVLETNKRNLFEQTKYLTLKEMELSASQAQNSILAEELMLMNSSMERLVPQEDMEVLAYRCEEYQSQFQSMMNLVVDTGNYI